MLTYSFQNMGKDSLYEYLYKCIRSDILAGRIRPGEKLPSKRSFARNLGVSVVTVESAYAQLAAEGYIDSRHSEIARRGPYQPGAADAPGAGPREPGPAPTRRELPERAEGEEAAEGKNGNRPCQRFHRSGPVSLYHMGQADADRSGGPEAGADGQSPGRRACRRCGRPSRTICASTREWISAGSR